MPRTVFFATLAVLLLPAVGAEGLLPVNPIVNGDFDTGFVVAGITPLREPLDRCIGIGHQVFVPVGSAWGDWAIDTTNAALADPTTLPEAASGEDFVADATTYPAQHAADIVAAPNTLVDCDPRFRDTSQPNPWNAAHDRGIGWSNDPATTFLDVDDDGDVEAVIPSVPAQHRHNLWQVTSTTQLFSADFDAFEFEIEAGNLHPSASVQIGLSLSPGFQQHPFVGVFWEGAVLFRADDMASTADGRVQMDPIADGEIICPANYTPCLEFQAEYAVEDDAGKHTLLGQTRIVQTSFWSFNDPAGPVVLDDIAFIGAKSAAETIPNAGNV